jgi:hypothetical protein
MMAGGDATDAVLQMPESSAMMPCKRFYFFLLT